MNTQQQIEKIKTALAAVDDEIGRTQAALQSASSNADDIRALRATLVDLQAQRSQLQTGHINLQASETEVTALLPGSGGSAEAAVTAAPKLTVVQADLSRPTDAGFAQKKRLRRTRTAAP